MLSVAKVLFARKMHVSNCNRIQSKGLILSLYTGPFRQWLFGNIPETLKEGGIYK